MTRTETKSAAQDELVAGLQASFTLARESGANAAVLTEMSVQMARVEKLFGYVPFSFYRGI